jgi:hypothetical protein
VASGWRAHSATAVPEVASASLSVDSVQFMRLDIQHYLSTMRKHSHMLRRIHNKCSITEAFPDYEGFNAPSGFMMNRSIDYGCNICSHKERFHDAVKHVMESLVGTLFIAYIAVVNALQFARSNDRHLFENSVEMYSTLVREALRLCDASAISCDRLVDPTARLLPEEVRTRFTKSMELLRAIMLLLDGSARFDHLPVCYSHGDTLKLTDYLVESGVANSPISCFNDHIMMDALFQKDSWLLDFDFDIINYCLCVTLPSYISHNLMYVLCRFHAHY